MVLVFPSTNPVQTLTAGVPGRSKVAQGGMDRAAVPPSSAATGAAASIIQGDGASRYEQADALSEGGGQERDRGGFEVTFNGGSSCPLKSGEVVT